MYLVTWLLIVLYYINNVYSQVGRESIQRCRAYREIGVSDVISPVIVGGTKAEEYEFPHMAALGFRNLHDRVWLCGGALVSENFVLTAAHCTFKQEHGAVKAVRLGATNVLNPEEFSKDYEVLKIILHPEYSFRTKYNDIALLRLIGNVIFNRRIKPICLQVYRYFNSYTLSATGWGSTYYDGPTSSDLLKVDLVLYDPQTCNNSYKNRLRSGIQDQSMICAGGKRNKVKDTCNGDSGGPLQIVYDYQYYLVGVTSFGARCGLPNVPAVYTRVSNYIAWIERNVWWYQL